MPSSLTYVKNQLAGRDGAFQKTRLFAQRAFYAFDFRNTGKVLDRASSVPAELYSPALSCD